jgi:hypothetical protein
MKLLIMQFSPTSCHFISLRSKYSPQQPFLKHSQSMFHSKRHNRTISKQNWKVVEGFLLHGVTVANHKTALVRTAGDKAEVWAWTLPNTKHKGYLIHRDVLTKCGMVWNDIQLRAFVYTVMKFWIQRNKGMMQAGIALNSDSSHTGLSWLKFTVFSSIASE